MRGDRKSNLGVVAGIKQGLADVEADRVVPHDEAMRRIRATIERAAKQAVKSNRRPRRPRD